MTLGPPADADLSWVLDQLKNPDIARALGWDGEVGAEVYSGYIEETVLLLPFFNAKNERIGFIMLMRPDTSVRAWTVNIVVPEPARRNGFTALAALDGLCHLVFEQRKDEELQWLIEPSNQASQVLPKRLGYPKRGTIERAGVLYDAYAIGPDAWRDRLDRLAGRGRRPEFTTEAVPLTEVAHGAVIRAVRGSSR